MLEHEEEVVLRALEAEDGIFEEIDDDFVKQADAEEEFEEVYQEYEEEEDEEEEIKAEEIAPDSELQDALNEFIHDHPSIFENKEGVIEKLQARDSQLKENHCLTRVLEEEEPDLNAMYEQLIARQPEDKFDVESIMSTYTNTDNRPAVVSLTQKKPRKTNDKETPDIKETVEKTGKSGHRDRTETAEQRKERKAAIKSQKKESRLKKKELKTLYKQEQLKQQKRDSMAYDVKDGLSVIKL